MIYYKLLLIILIIVLLLINMSFYESFTDDCITFNHTKHLNMMNTLDKSNKFIISV